MISSKEIPPGPRGARMCTEGVHIRMTQLQMDHLRNAGAKVKDILPPSRVTPEGEIESMAWGKHKNRKLLHQEAGLHAANQAMFEQIVEVGKHLDVGVGVGELEGRCPYLSDANTCQNRMLPDDCALYIEVFGDLLAAEVEVSLPATTTQPPS